jgi:signal transduction histidine kinase
MLISMGMESLVQTFEAELSSNQELDRAYYANPHPSFAERMAYNQRKESVERLREHFYAGLKAISSFPVDAEVFEIVIPARKQLQQVVSAPQCRLSHDLNNCLSVILGYADFLRDKLSSDEEAMRYLDHIVSASRRMAALIKESRCGISADLRRLPV